MQRCWGFSCSNTGSSVGLRFSGSCRPMVVMGAAMLWVGWFGFNGGSVAAETWAAMAILLHTLVPQLEL